MTARLSIRRSEADGLVLCTKLRKRAGFAVAFAVLLAAMATSLDPARDFLPERAPLTVLFCFGMAGSLGAAMASRRLIVRRGTRLLRIEHRAAWLLLRAEGIEVEPGAQMIVHRQGQERGPYVLELQQAGGHVVLDSSSWRSELEPLGRALAEALELPAAV